jgi:hypothetical protein
MRSSSVMSREIGSRQFGWMFCLNLQGLINPGGTEEWNPQLGRNKNFRTHMYYTVSHEKNLPNSAWNTDFFSDGATAPSGPGPPHYRGFTITLRHTAIGRTPLDKWSARSRDFYLTIHNTHKRQTSISPAGSNPQSQQASVRRPTP